MSDDVQFTRLGGLGRILLDRPKALNALTLDQVHAITPQLTAWAADPSVTAILIEGAGDRAFCAGGDIRALQEDCVNGDLAGVDSFYRHEYRLNRQIKTYPKPYVAFLDGVTMGGGVGVSVHGWARVATERTLFAMPETGIGFFPDVGGSFFLPRCPGQTGMYLALTGARLKAADLVYVGVATHYVPSDQLDALRDALAAGTDPAAALAAAHQDPGPAPLADKRAVIDACFGGDSVLAILAALDAHPDPWAQTTAATIRSKSPFACLVTYEQVRRGGTLSFDDCMKMELRLAMRVAPNPDFIEGVRAVIIDKDNKPVWSPARVEDVPEAAWRAPFDAPPPAGELSFIE